MYIPTYFLTKNPIFDSYVSNISVRLQFAYPAGWEKFIYIDEQSQNNTFRGEKIKYVGCRYTINVHNLFM